LWFTARVIEPGEDRRGVGHDAGDAVVRPLARAAHRRCSRPGCPAPAGASLVFSYATREVWLDQLGESSPQTYDLCSGHAGRTQPPRGWQLRDRRPADERASDEPSSATLSLDSEQTVAVLAAALRAVPDLPAASDEEEDRPQVAHVTAAAPAIEPSTADEQVSDALVDEPYHPEQPTGVAQSELFPPSLDELDQLDQLDQLERSQPEPGTVSEDDPSLVVGHGAAPGGSSGPEPAAGREPAAGPKPILAARPRLASPPARGDRAADW
jgi:hypothetical protein